MRVPAGDGKSTPSQSHRKARPLETQGRRCAGKRSKEVKMAVSQASLTCFLRSVMIFCISTTNSLKSLVAGPSKCSRVADVALPRYLPCFTLRGSDKIQHVSVQISANVPKCTPSVERPVQHTTAQHRQVGHGPHLLCALGHFCFSQPRLPLGCKATARPHPVPETHYRWDTSQTPPNVTLQPSAALLSLWAYLPRS